MMRRLFFALFALLSLSTVTAQTLPDIDLERLQRATVFVMQARNEGDDLLVTCVGSGTIVKRDGLILTNAHNTLVSETCPGEELIVGISNRLDEPPILRYRAEVAQASPGLDLALLRITRELDGRLIDPGTLALPFVELADSDAVQLDETITVVGYPGLSDDPIETRRGTVIGFVAEPSGGEKSWMKTSAAIPGVMSGGGAFNQAGQLVGIPTTSPVVTTTADTTCQPIQDTNADSVINSDDICIPVGGFINAIRPSNFARPLLRAASLGLALDFAGSASQQSFQNPGAAPEFSRLFFSPSVNEAGMPTSVIRTLPAGSNSLFLFFDYANMTPETVYELRVTTDGIPNPTFSLAPVRWSGGERGMWYLGSSGQPWPNGVYEFTLFADGVAAPTARLVIGGAPESNPTFSDIVFGLLDLRNNPLGNGFVLPTGNIASARFLFRNLENGGEWTSIWYLNGAEFSRQTNTWSEGPSGSTTTSIRSDAGLPPGSYRLELYIGTGLAATSDFTIAGGAQGAFPEVFANERFAAASTSQEAASAPPLSNFPPEVAEIYALFDWQQIAPGTLWTMRWFVDDDLFFERTSPWVNAESGEDFLMRLAAPGGVPDGTYRMDLLLNNILLGSMQAQVGIGQLPIDPFAQASGVQLRGQILDADTREGIPGVSFILISEDYSVIDFVWNQNQVYALAVTDRNGRFQLDRPLQLSNDTTEFAYSAIITADGYLPLTADGIVVNAETENPLDIVIYMIRD